MEIVRVENLTFTYPEATSAALTAVDLSLVPGEFDHALRQKRQRQIHPVTALKAVGFAGRPHFRRAFI